MVKKLSSLITLYVYIIDGQYIMDVIIIPYMYHIVYMSNSHVEQIFNAFKIINKLLLTLNVKKKIKVYPHLQRILLTEFKNSDFIVYMEKRFAIKQVGLGCFATFWCLCV